MPSRDSPLLLNLGEVIEAQVAIIKKSGEDITAAKESMAEATKQREGDNADFVEAVDLNKQAVELIQKAKNKLNTYYNPQLVPKEAAPELSAEEELEAGARSVLIQKHSFTQTDSEKLPGDQPETWAAGDRKNKGQKGASVMALMDMLPGISIRIPLLWSTLKTSPKKTTRNCHKTSPTRLPNRPPL